MSTNNSPTPTPSKIRSKWRELLLPKPSDLSYRPPTSLPPHNLHPQHDPSLPPPPTQNAEYFNYVFSVMENHEKNKYPYSSESSPSTFYGEADVPEYIESHEYAKTIVTDMNKFNLESIDPFELMAHAKTSEDRVHAQRVIGEVCKIGIILLIVYNNILKNLKLLQQFQGMMLRKHLNIFS